jgi:glycosyltransferase involved in cell wall biosynthesis
MTRKPSKKKASKIAIFHAFFKNRGGAEMLVFDLRNYFQADLWTGAIRLDLFSPDKTDSFSQNLFDPRYKLIYLDRDGTRPGLLHLRRQWNFLFNPKIKHLLDYDTVIFSGNIFWVIQRLRKMRDRLNPGKTTPKPKLVVYCHTPPRPFTDRQTEFLAKLPALFRPLYKLLGCLVRHFYRQELLAADLVITNSFNTQQRLKHYIGLDSEVIFPGVHVERFRYLRTEDFFLSYSRLEETKRIPMIVEAFAQMPDKKLVICSSGPLQSWVESQIESRGLKNITFEGMVTDQRLAELVGSCLAGIVIPVNEDAGITQVELMAAGKPVIGVNEGGLKETIIDQQTGILIPENPEVEDLIKAVKEMTSERAWQMKSASQKHAQQFATKVFFKKMKKIV